MNHYLFSCTEVRVGILFSVCEVARVSLSRIDEAPNDDQLAHEPGALVGRVIVSLAGASQNSVKLVFDSCLMRPLWGYRSEIVVVTSREKGWVSHGTGCVRRYGRDLIPYTRVSATETYARLTAPEC